MKGIAGVLVGLLWANASYAAAIKSNGTGAGNWSSSETWAGGVVPGNGDTVTLVSPDVVTYDVDQSGFANGIGLTVNSGARLECSTSPGVYYLKCNANLTLNGTLQAGTSFKHLCETAQMQCHRQTETTVEPGQTLRVKGKIRIADDHSGWAPRLEIIDPDADPLVDDKNAALASGAIPRPDGSFRDWQDVSVSFTNTGLLGKKVCIRCSAKRASGTMYEVWSTSVAP